MNINQEEWPKIGDKLKFRGTHHFWFTYIIGNAKSHLKEGEFYTLSKIDIFSSWVRIQVKEVPDVDFTLGFFEY